jgi:hypothetical protein
MTGGAAAIPQLVPHCRWCCWWRLKCPACPATFANGIWQQSAIGYPMHYAVDHLGISPFRRT